MPAPELHDVLAQLASRTARLEALQAEMAARDRRRRARTARRLPVLLVVLFVALAPLSLLAANPFNDLNPGSPHNANIDAIYVAGVTRGCDPDVAYCPNGLVTREEMASFLARLGGLGANPPVADARTLQGYAPSGLARAARATTATPLPLTTALQTYLTVTLDAPAPGFVVLGGNVNFVSRTAVGSVRPAEEYAMMYADLAHDQGAADNNATAAVATMRLLQNAWAAVPVGHVFPVGAGPQTFRARVVMYAEGNIDTSLACESPSSCLIDARSATLTALYVPFGPTGGSTLDLP